MRKTVSKLLKWGIVFSSLVGVFVSLFTARADGYSPWAMRILYFTAQSNLWIGVTVLLILLFPKEGKRKDRLYLLRYFFTVSITMTGLIYCCFLGPLADESYHPWSFTSILTHVLAPSLSAADFFVDDRPMELHVKHVLLSTLPPLFYFTVAIVLGLFNVNFGRGVPYPYFFLNFRAPAGFFGFVREPLPNMGTAYWILLLGIMVLGLGSVYAYFHPESVRRRRKERAELLRSAV